MITVCACAVLPVLILFLAHFYKYFLPNKAVIYTEAKRLVSNAIKRSKDQVAA